MHIKPRVASVVGEVADTSWSQVLNLPHAVAVIEIQSELAQAREVGIRLLSVLTEKLKSKPNSLSDVKHLARQLLTRDVITLIILVPVGEIIYVVLCGKGAVYLKRGSEFSTLIADNGEVSGAVEVGDTILMATKSLSLFLTDEDVAGLFNNLAAEDIAEKLTMLIHQRPDLCFGSGLIYQIEDFIEEDQSDPNIPEEPPTGQIRARYYVPDVGFIKSLSGIFTNFLMRIKGLFSRATFGSKKIKLLALILALLFFVGSVFLGIKKQTESRINRDATAKIKDAQHAYDEGLALLELNPLLARQRLSQAKSILASVIGKIPEGLPEKKEINELYSKVRTDLEIALQRHQITPQLFYDVGLLKNNAQAMAMAVYGDTVGMIDRNFSIYELDAQSKKAVIVGGGRSMNGIKYIDVSADEMILFSDQSIYRLIRGQDQKSKKIISRSEDWGEIVSMVAYGGNIYLLDRTKSRIWKYTSLEDGYSPLREYLSADTRPDLSQAVNMAIDGSVWVAMRNGQIIKFTSGAVDSFVPSGIDPSLGDNLQIFTNDGVENLYVLDTDNSRLVVLNKKGEYKAQYVWPKTLVVQSIIAVKSVGKALLLSGGKIYSIDLK